jgi:hypothetical protein
VAEVSGQGLTFFMGQVLIRKDLLFRGDKYILYNLKPYSRKVKINSQELAKACTIYASTSFYGRKVCLA